jgi:hypothetical protein
VGGVTLICYELKLNLSTTAFFYLIIVIMQSRTGDLVSSAVIQEFRGVVVVLVLDAVVGVIAHPAWNSNVHSAATGCVPDSRPVTEAPVGLPSVDKPRLDFQMRGGKNLHSYTIEEPRRVGRDIRRLISPVVKVVITEESYVRT